MMVRAPESLRCGDRLDRTPTKSPNLGFSTLGPNDLDLDWDLKLLDASSICGTPSSKLQKWRHSTRLGNPLGSGVPTCIRIESVRDIERCNVQQHQLNE